MDTEGHSDFLTREEINALLNVNRQGNTWNETAHEMGKWPDDQGTRQLKIGQIWRRGDGATTWLDPSREEITIEAKSRIDSDEAAFKAIHATSLEGF